MQHYQVIHNECTDAQHGDEVPEGSWGRGVFLCGLGGRKAEEVERHDIEGVHKVGQIQIEIRRKGRKCIGDLFGLLKLLLDPGGGCGRRTAATLIGLPVEVVVVGGGVGTADGGVGCGLVLLVVPGSTVGMPRTAPLAINIAAACWGWGWG